ncbi:MAG: AAA family ATPase [Bacteroidales bacterium]|nr:AAA family ATPase [Bacteroidales bacterium]
MKLKVNNLGAIKEGEIDLSQKFIVFCGPNGTGKTYLSYVIYGLLKRRLHIQGSEVFAEKLINEKEAVLEIDFEKLFQYRNNMISTVESSLDELFGIGDSDIKKLFGDFHCEFTIGNEDFKHYIVDTAFEDGSKLQGVQVKISKESGSTQLRVSILNDAIPNDSIRGLKFLLDSYIYNYLATHPIGNVEIFPVERNSIYTFSKELSVRKQEALDNVLLLMDKEKKVDRFDLYFRNNYKYPLPIRIGLETADNLVNLKKKECQFLPFSSFVEEKLLHGRVQVSNEGEIQFRPSQSLRTTLPIQMTASVVKTLSSLDLYLKHIAAINDLIIIDEPEINLHPDNQIMVARMLVRLMNSGFRVLLSTHSDYIVREINNMVMMSHRGSKVVKGLLASETYTENDYINPEDLGVYYFNYSSSRSKQVKVEKVKVGMSGFSVKSIDTTIESQNKIAEELYYGIKYDDKE